MPAVSLAKGFGDVNPNGGVGWADREGGEGVSLSHRSGLDFLD